MKKSIEKTIKRWLKRKITVTLGIIINFIITGGVVYSNDSIINQKVTIKVTEGRLVIEVDGKQTEIENTWTNNGTIGIKNESGIIIENSVSNLELKIFNNGLINGNGLEESLGNGIFNEGTIETLTNYGIVIGNGSGDSIKHSGNGVYNSDKSKITTLTNYGIIAGNRKGNGTGSFSGNGVFNSYRETITTLSSYGIIVGSGYGTISDTYSSGNGIVNSEYGTIETLTNYGVVTGNGDNSPRTLGNGILNDVQSKITTLTNYGIINGNGSGGDSGNGIFNKAGTITTLTNYGIIAGNNKAIYNIDSGSNTGVITTQNNYGLLIDGAGTDKVTINVGAGGEIKEGEYKGYTVKNTFDEGKVSDINNEKDIILSNNNDKVIINGYNKGLEVSDDLTLSNSVINSYTTAINIVGGDFIGDNIIVNGGADKKYNEEGKIVSESATIKGSANVDNLTLKGNSIINGNIDLGTGNDNLTISDTVQLNGDLIGNNITKVRDNDVLNFVSSNTKDGNINLYHKVNGFENINVGTNVTLFENAEVTGADNITVQKDGNLVLRIDGQNNNSHALSGNAGTISSNGGKLLLALNGVGEGATIEFGNTQLDETIKGNEIGYSSDITLDTTSLLHNITKVDGNTVTVNTVENLPVDFMPTSVDYSQLNTIYQSMREANQVKEFNVTDNKQLSGFTNYLHDIYVNNPYSFSSTLSRKSISMFSDVVMGRDLYPEINKWAIYGGFSHIDGGTKDTYYGKGYYTYDIGSKDIDVDNKITGMYAQGEYGINETLNFGVIFGGNQTESEINNNSKVEGDSFYLGTYVKKYLDNLRLVAGLGYQYGDYEADRIAIGYEDITTTRTFDSNYNDNTFNMYAQAKYSNKLANNLYLEPSVALDYTYINQEEISENGVLAIETEDKDFSYTTAKFGVDLKKEIPTTNATHSLLAGVYYNRMLDGYKEENIIGRFKDGSDFNILVSPSNKHELGLRAKYEVFLNNGITFDVKGSYTFERESYSEENKNTYKGEWTIGAGIGYKF